MTNNLENDVVITHFSNATKEGITLHLNKKATLKTGNVANNKIWVSWDKIGSLLFDKYVTLNDVRERNALRKQSLTPPNRRG